MCANIGVPDGFSYTGIGDREGMRGTNSFRTRQGSNSCTAGGNAWSAKDGADEDSASLRPVKKSITLHVA